MELCPIGPFSNPSTLQPVYMCLYCIAIQPIMCLACVVLWNIWGGKKHTFWKQNFISVVVLHCQKCAHIWSELLTNNVDKSWAYAALKPWEFIYMLELILLRILKNNGNGKKRSWKRWAKLKRLISIPHMIKKNIRFYKRFLFIGLTRTARKKTLFTDDYIKNNK